MRLWTVGLTLAALSAVCAPSEARDLRLPVQEKVQDLLLYSVSEAYFTLREHLGLQIRV